MLRFVARFWAKLHELTQEREESRTSDKMFRSVYDNARNPFDESADTSTSAQTILHLTLFRALSVRLRLNRSFVEGHDTSPAQTCPSRLNRFASRTRSPSRQPQLPYRGPRLGPASPS
jgi:hypothetical protein